MEVQPGPASVRGAENKNRSRFQDSAASAGETSASSPSKLHHKAFSLPFEPEIAPVGRKIPVAIHGCLPTLGV